MERGKKELFFVQKTKCFVQKIKKRPDKFEETRAYNRQNEMRAV